MSIKPRIPLSGPREALQSPFAGLNIPDLPEGIDLPVEEKKSVGKPGRVVLRKEKSQRGGKTVIVVSGFQPEFLDADIEELAREARKQCGCGGTVRDREMEFQGDNPAMVRKYFETAGFRVAGI